MKNKSAGKKTRYLLYLVLIITIAIQFIRPGISNPPVTQDVEAGDSVKLVLRKACYNCHSNETKLAWFDYIAPGNWLVAEHVQKARKALNFSEWDKIPKDHQKGVLFEALNHMEFRTMPLPAYMLLHPMSKITETETNVLKSYLRTQFVAAMPDTSKEIAWKKQYHRWIQGHALKPDVLPSLNGIPFSYGYEDWVAVSTTIREDNGTLKMIMGNPVAAAAVKAGQTNPWPDGAALAKITWAQMMDSSGNIHTGEFKQIAFMQKDSRKYRSTDGWGYSQWDKGLALIPHGRNATFTSDCVNCHQPMRNSDFVFTFPLQLRDNPILEDKVIALLVNKKLKTMSTLYGNDTAVRFARSATGINFPGGAVLTLVTWHQKQDSHWFGASIPGNIISTEKIIIKDTNHLPGSIIYKLYYADNTAKESEVDDQYASDRIQYILSQRASILP